MKQKEGFVTIFLEPINWDIMHISKRDLPFLVLSSQFQDTLPAQQSDQGKAAFQTNEAGVRLSGQWERIWSS